MWKVVRKSDGGKDCRGENRMTATVTAMKQTTIIEMATKRESSIKGKGVGALRRELQGTCAAVEHHRKKDDPTICEVDDCSMGECFFCLACGVKLCPSHLSELLHPCKQWRRLDYYFTNAQGARGVAA